MIINKLDSIEFRLKELHDFTWLKKYGTAFGLQMKPAQDVFVLGWRMLKENIFVKLQE